MAKPVMHSAAAFGKTSDAAAHISGAQFRSMELEQIRVQLTSFSKSNRVFRLKASREHMSLVHDVVNDKRKKAISTQSGSDPFSEIKHRFLSFKKDKYMADLEHFKALAKAQAPKFMVIACADSRVCPSSVLGFEPGEAFVIRNVANLVPRYENGPTEVNAALEFAVNSLNVENILVVGHSRCGGIQALMSMEEDGMNSSGFLHSWVAVGKPARLNTKAVASKLTFDLQCKHCEKESINRSLMNLLTYPWIKDKVAERQLVIHGGYYDFVNCTFEKWSLDHEEDASTLGAQYSITNREFWS